MSLQCSQRTQPLGLIRALCSGNHALQVLNRRGPVQSQDVRQSKVVLRAGWPCSSSFLPVADFSFRARYLHHQETACEEARKDARKQGDPAEKFF